MQEGRSLRRLRIILVVGLVGLLLASVVTGFLHPSAVDVALTKCAEEGWPKEDLALKAYGGTGGLLERTELVEFLVKKGDRPRVLQVIVRKPIYFWPWQVMGFRDDVAAEEK